MRISDWSSDVCSSDLAGRPPQDHRRELADADHAPDRAFRAGQMFLPPDIVERARPQPIGERRGIVRRRNRGLGGFLVGEKVCHRAGKSGWVSEEVRESGVEGKGGLVRVRRGGRRFINKKTKTTNKKI